MVEWNQEKNVWRESRDLIPSKLSADLLSLRDMVMPLAPVQCSVKKRGLGGQIKSGRDGREGGTATAARSLARSLCHCPAPLPCCNNTARRARGQCTPARRLPHSIWH